MEYNKMESVTESTRSGSTAMSIDEDFSRYQSQPLIKDDTEHATEHPEGNNISGKTCKKIIKKARIIVVGTKPFLYNQ